jgi:hypothetical protein
MEPVQTLHAFTLNLLNDPMALTAFAADPESALAVAGLSDISATDVHEVLPLVLDYVPVDSLAGQGVQFDSLTDGNLGAIDQLKALTQNLVLNSDYGTDTGMMASVSGVAGIAEDPATAFSSVNDLSQGLDSTVSGAVGNSVGFGDTVNTVTGAVGGVSGGDLTSHLTGGDVTGALDGGDYTTGIDSAVSHVTAITSGIGGVDSAIGGITSVGGIGDATSHFGGATSHFGGVTGHLDDISHHGTVGDLTSHVSDVANHVGDVNAGVSAVHDVVSGVGNIGEVGDIGHVDVGGVLSGNDIHFSH